MLPVQMQKPSMLSSQQQEVGLYVSLYRVFVGLESREKYKSNMTKSKETAVMFSELWMNLLDCLMIVPSSSVRLDPIYLQFTTNRIIST